MDVSRIEAISPKQIDWRKLTSKEIIKYDNQGISVPDVYLQWAKNFLSDVTSTDKDETTYEMATMSGGKTSESKTTSTVNADEDGVNSTAQDSQIDDSQKTDDKTEKSEEEMTASEKREKMQNEDGIYKTATAFTNISKQNKAECKSVEEIISNAQSQAADEIAVLDSYMSNLLSEIEDLKSQLKSEQNKKVNRNIKAIKELNQQIQKQGQAGQSTLASGEASIQGVQTSVDDFSTLIDNTSEYGAETIDIGKDVLKKFHPLFIYPLIVGFKAIAAGGDAIEQADNTNEIQSEAHKEIHSGLSDISGYKNDLQDKTGVEGFSISQGAEANDKTEQNGENAESSTNSKQAQSKNDAKSNAPELDESVKAHSSLDEILKRKLRRGENIEA